MNKFEVVEVIGEGTYGVVVKAINKVSKEVVAIKKFKENAKGFIRRELKMLNHLKSCEFIVNLKEAYRRKEKIYFIFEYVDKSMLQILLDNPSGLSQQLCKHLIFQLSKAIEKCHSIDIIHRDIKPENLLIDKNYHLKLCDFGFARHTSTTEENDRYTEYVATRWYRSPELLLFCPYDKPVDVWAIGCIACELSNGKPLFPGKSDLDQLHQIMTVMGPLPDYQLDESKRSGKFVNLKTNKFEKSGSLEKRLSNSMDSSLLDFTKNCLSLNPRNRLKIGECITHYALESELRAYVSQKSVDSQLAPILPFSIMLGLVGNSPLRKEPKELKLKKLVPCEPVIGLSSRHNNNNKQVEQQQMHHHQQQQKQQQQHLLHFEHPSDEDDDNDVENSSELRNSSALNGATMPPTVLLSEARNRLIDSRLRASLRPIANLVAPFANNINTNANKNHHHSSEAERLGVHSFGKTTLATGAKANSNSKNGCSGINYQQAAINGSNKYLSKRDVHDIGQIRKCNDTFYTAHNNGDDRNNVVVSNMSVYNNATNNQSRTASRQDSSPDFRQHFMQHNRKGDDLNPHAPNVKRSKSTLESYQATEMNRSDNNKHGKRKTSVTPTNVNLRNAHANSIGGMLRNNELRVSVDGVSNHAVERKCAIDILPTTNQDSMRLRRAPKKN